MNHREVRLYQMLVRVNAFGAARPGAFPAGTVGAQMFATVRTCVRDVTQLAVSQMSGHGNVRNATTSKAAARRALYESLQAIRRTARALALDTPGFDRKFRLPRGGGDQVLLNASRAIAQHARQPAAAFISHGLPQTFLDDLCAAIDRFEQTIRDRAAGRAALLSAGVGLEVALGAGFLAVQRLDAVVPNVLRDDPETIAAWRTARHIVRRVRSRTDRTADSRVEIAPRSKFIAV